MIFHLSGVCVAVPVINAGGANIAGVPVYFCTAEDWAIAAGSDSQLA